MIPSLWATRQELLSHVSRAAISSISRRTLRRLASSAGSASWASASVTTKSPLFHAFRRSASYYMDLELPLGHDLDEEAQLGRLGAARQLLDHGQHRVDQLAAGLSRAGDKPAVVQKLGDLGLGRFGVAGGGLPKLQERLARLGV